MYDFRLEEVAAWIDKVGARTVAVQMPEGLKTHAQDVSHEIEARTASASLRMPWCSLAMLTSLR